MALVVWVKGLGDLVEEGKESVNHMYASLMDTVLDRQYATWQLWAGVLFGLVFTLLPIDSASPTYSLLAPLGWLSNVQLWHKTFRMEDYLRTADSQWGASPWYGSLYLNSLAKKKNSAELHAVLSRSDEGYLNIKANVDPGPMAQPRLLPQPLL